MGENKTYYAMVMSRSSVDGVLGDTIDISAYMVHAESEEDVRSKLKEKASAFSYKNEDGGVVQWPIQRILAVDQCHHLESGDEVTGFTIRMDEIGDLV